MKRIYIAGRITGIEVIASFFFEEAEKELLAQGYEVINPMKLPHQHDKAWESYMKECIRELCTCTEIFMLRGWEESCGAILERGLAQMLDLQRNYQ
jgi:hypothetical protein